MPSLLDGRWEAIRIDNTGNPLVPVMNTQQTAVHACLAYNPNDDTWRVLYFRAADLERPPDPPLPPATMKTRMWNPSTEVANPITEQLIPDWPGGAEKPRLFCGGHAFMHDGRLLAVGGNLGPVVNPPPFQGLTYAYIFDPTASDENSKWNYLGSPGSPKPMQNGRWYPTVTLLPNRWLLVMSGFTTQPTFNRLPEIWSPDTQNWIQRTHPEAQMPFITLYPTAHVVPRGQFEGKVFYSMPSKAVGNQLKRQSYVFDPYFDGVPNGQYYWKTVGAQSEVIRDDGCSVLLPIKPSPNTDAKVLILGGRQDNAEFGTQVANNSAEIINLGDGTPHGSQQHQWRSHGTMRTP